MSSLGIMECNRCRLLQMQKEAEKQKMTITKRESYYGVYPGSFEAGVIVGPKGVKGIDIYIHPKSFEVPSNFKWFHGCNPENLFMFTEQDPERWFYGWLSAIPSKCECRAA